MIAPVLVGLQVQIKTENRKRPRLERGNAVELGGKLIEGRHAAAVASDMPGNTKFRLKI